MMVVSVRALSTQQAPQVLEGGEGGQLLLQVMNRA